jgi:DNA-binding NarL/FixJ family response regulator
VLIVDDHPLFRKGLRELVGADPRFEVLDETGDGAAALDVILRRKPDVAILDVNLPALSGLEVARRIQGKNLPTRVVMLTMHNEEEMFNRALDFGVMGFVLKENTAQEILDCLAAVAGGGHYLSPSLSGHAIRRRGRANELAARKPGMEDLTKAELRILKLVAQNMTSREIGAALFISPRTVETHRKNICAKLGLRGSHGLLQFALENRSSL